jgi:hypothetical protein
MSTTAKSIRQTALAVSAIAAWALVTALATAADPQPAETKPANNSDTQKAVVLDPVGAPKNTTGRKRHDYHVWYADGWWYIRGSDKSKQSVFYQGSVQVDGGEITESSWPGIDKRKDKKVRDWVSMDRNNKGFKFLFRNIGGKDTIRFKVSESAKSIKFGLSIDRDTSPENVKVGQSKAHPATNPFVLPAHPQGAPAASGDVDKTTDSENVKEDQTKTQPK